MMVSNEISDILVHLQQEVEEIKRAWARLAYEPKTWLTVAEAVDRMGLNEKTFYNNLEHFPFVIRLQRPRIVRIDERLMTRWMEKQRPAHQRHGVFNQTELDL